MKNDQVKLVAQLATSDDLQKINRQVVDRVRFQFITKPLFGKADPNGKSELAQQLQTKHTLYESGEDLLEGALKYTQFTHHRHLRYLADNHAGHFVKIHFCVTAFCICVSSGRLSAIPYYS